MNARVEMTSVLLGGAVDVIDTASASVVFPALLPRDVLKEVRVYLQLAVAAGYEPTDITNNPLRLRLLAFNTPRQPLTGTGQVADEVIADVVLQPMFQAVTADDAGLGVEFYYGVQQVIPAFYFISQYRFLAIRLDNDSTVTVRGNVYVRLDREVPKRTE